LNARSSRARCGSVVPKFLMMVVLFAGAGVEAEPLGFVDGGAGVDGAGHGEEEV
jgi:hypothetical protein